MELNKTTIEAAKLGSNTDVMSLINHIDIDDNLAERLQRMSTQDSTALEARHIVLNLAEAQLPTSC